MKKQKTVMRHVRLAGMGKALAGGELCFAGEKRYRLRAGETFSDLMYQASCRALAAAGMEIEDMDCIVCATATPVQAIPCNAALLHERLAKGLDIPAFDVNSTCTSFVTALDVLSCMTEMGRYRRVLIVSGDMASAALNPAQRESYELFSDGAAACVLTAARPSVSSAMLRECRRALTTRRSGAAAVRFRFFPWRKAIGRIITLI